MMASWQLVSLGELRHVHDLHASEDGVTIVGAATDGGVEVKPMIWHLSL